MTLALIRRLLAAVALLFVTQPVSAYWEYGHETVAAIAYANVKPATRAKIRRLLAESKVMDTPECPTNTIELAAYWADCVKPLKDANGKGRFDYAYSWHYQNVNVCQPFDLMPACKDGNCVSAQIERDVTILKDPKATTKAKVEALVFLIHFVGDLHQPLHAGDRGDKGGNDVKADYGFYGPARFNLHSIWDGPLAERAISTGPSLVRRYPAADRARIAAGSVTDWSRESWAIARAATYATALGGDPCGPAPTNRVKLDNATIAGLVPTVRLEVERGGLRLARLLDAVLG